VQNYHDVIVKKFLSVDDDETGLKMLIPTDKPEVLPNINKLLKTNDQLSISLVIKRCICRMNVYVLKFFFVDFEPNRFVSVCCFRC
jgi:hypothetical protein